jgi:ArsR family transcriptional regulator
MELVRAARSLGDPQRVRVLNLLMQRECCVCEVMQALRISQVNASRYCHALQDAGFASMRKEGRWRHYRVNRECSPVLRDLLGAVSRQASVDSVFRDDIARLARTKRCSQTFPAAEPDGLSPA